MANTQILAANEIMAIGLHLMGFDYDKKGKRRPTTNESWFHNDFGSYPLVLALLWEDLDYIEYSRVSTQDASKVECKEFLNCNLLPS
jgi:hypothetical protein